MSILDGLISSQAELKQSIEVASRAAGRVIEAVRPNEGLKQVVALMNKGLSLADIFNIDERDRNAVFLLGCKLFQAGDREKARAVLTRLAMLEPMDPRPLYVLGAIHQQEQDFAAAAKYYVHFLALDATNPEGYLRLGECLFGARELKEAAECFSAAIALCRPGGKPEHKAHAEKFLALIADVSARPSNS